MKRGRKLALGTLVALLLLVLVGPFLVPVPPLEGLRPASDLADPDSRFVRLNGLQVHYKEAGQGETTLILLHGFASSLFSWREVMAPLAEQYRVVAFDRPAFGLTERPMEWDGPNPYSPAAQVELVVALMDHLGIQQAVLVGNSAGGTVAAEVALKYPQRVQALVLVDAAIYSGGGAPAFVRPLLATPQMRHLGPLVARRIQGFGRNFAELAWHDPAKITSEVWAGYSKPLQIENWDRALWEMTAASRNTGVAQRLAELTMPALVITGDDDRIVPTEQSVRLAGELPKSELVVVPNCGHVPQEECSQPFLEAVEGFLSGLITSGDN